MQKIIASSFDKNFLWGVAMAAAQNEGGYNTDGRGPSISWSRIFPDGTGRVNKEGVAFYHKVIDECLLLGLTPFVTLYHWDLPHALQKEGGWTSVHMLKWFTRYTTFCAEEFGDKIKNWIILNEPMGFTAK